MQYKQEAKRLQDQRDELLVACESALTFARAAIECAGQSQNEIEEHSIIRMLKSVISKVRKGV